MGHEKCFIIIAIIVGLWLLQGKIRAVPSDTVAMETWLVQIKMCWKYKIYTGLSRLSIMEGM